MINKIWVRENFRMMPRCLVWTSEWSYILSKIKYTEKAAGLRVQNKGYSSRQVKFQVSEEYQSDVH